MGHDAQALRFLSDDERCADLINGIGFAGRQVLTPGDLSELDSQVLYRAGKPEVIGKKKSQKKLYRDLIRKAAFGVNFVIIGIEHQDEVHYLMPLRTLSYDTGEYEKQAKKIRKTVKKQKGLDSAEYLSGFRRTDRLNPCITFVLYFGENWDGSKDLHGLFDWTDIPEELKKLVGNYPLNLIEVRKIKDTSVFKTDIRQVFDFIRFENDKAAMYDLVLKDDSYRNIAEDAYDLIASYTDMSECIDRKDEYREGDKINMCRAIKEMLRDERNEGFSLGKNEGISIGRSEGFDLGRKNGFDEKTRIMVKNMLQRGYADEEICALAECGMRLVDEVRQNS